MPDSIAILSDIQGNLPALLAVRADMESQGIEKVLCLGDVVGYGAQPAECMERLRSKNWVTLLPGNHDAYVASDIDPPGLSPETRQRESHRLPWLCCLFGLLD